VGDYPKIEHLVNLADRAGANLAAMRDLEPYVSADLADKIENLIGLLGEVREEAVQERDETLGGPVRQVSDTTIDVQAGTAPEGGITSMPVTRGEG